MIQVRLLVGIACFLSCQAFYQPKLADNLPVVRPKTINQLKRALIDDTPTKVIIAKVFDFTAAEGSITELGCHHRNSPVECLTKGQLKLNVNDQCAGLTPANVSYSRAGSFGIFVGSNKVIQGVRGGGLKGKGLILYNSKNVEVRNISITDINTQVIWGGDAIDLWNAHNVLIDGCLVKNVGRQMVVTHFGACTGVTISNTVFDGITPYANYCQGNHYWLWLFLGEGDRITLQNNVITGTAGRGPKLLGANNSKILLHMIQNIFYNVVETGLLDLGDDKSSVVIEGNLFFNVSLIVSKNLGNIFMPQDAADAESCVLFLGRKCLLNTVVDSGCAKVNNSVLALQDFGAEKELLTKPIDMKASITSLIKIPDEVKQYIK